MKTVKDLWTEHYPNVSRRCVLFKQITLSKYEGYIVTWKACFKLMVGSSCYHQKYRQEVFQIREGSQVKNQGTRLAS